MKKYFLLRRKKTVAMDNYFEFVKWLRKTDVEHWKTNGDYMNAYSRRHSLHGAIVIDCSSEERFIESLIALGYIKLVDDVKFWEALRFKIKNFHKKYLNDRIKVMKRNHKKRKWMDSVENLKFQNRNTYRE